MLEFDSSLIALDTWREKEDKLSAFFGPNLQAEVSQPREGKIDLTLMTIPEVEKT